MRVQRLAARIGGPAEIVQRRRFAETHAFVVGQPLSGRGVGQQAVERATPAGTGPDAAGGSVG